LVLGLKNIRNINMPDLLIKNATIVNEGRRYKGSVLIDNQKINAIYEGESSIHADKIIDANDLFLLPGVIDDQVHFREPGLTYKGDIRSESRAAAAGGVTSYMEMPNTQPQTITQSLLNEKFNIAQSSSLVNYSFYIGATNNNVKELLKSDPKHVCGIKVFMGASTGNMLVDNPKSLRDIFSAAHMLVAVHCEDETIIRANVEEYRNRFGETVQMKYHPQIRSEEACYSSSPQAVELASKFGTRLHILHLSTGKELQLFKAGGDLRTKQLTNEVCIHHLWFNQSDYQQLGTRIKWNPSIKSASDQSALFQGVLDDKIDIIATDHAPHTLEEKGKNYFQAPSGGPLVQHSLTAMLEFYKRGSITIEQIVNKMCHAPAEVFHISKRGYIREGYWADLVLVDLNKPWRVEKSNILYKCRWSPFEGTEFSSSIVATLVNGNRVYEHGQIQEGSTAMALTFDR
jgi:dihydroorotase